MRRLLAILLLLMLAAPTAVASTPISLSDFAVRLQESAQALERGSFATVQANFPTDEIMVTAPEGEVAVDMRWLRQALNRQVRPGSERDALVGQLRAMAAEARAIDRLGGSGLQARLEQAARDRATLEQILQGAGFREAERSDWWSRFWRGVGEWWEGSVARPWRERFSGFDLPGLPQGSTARTLGGLLLVAIIAMLLWLGRDFLSLERLRRLFRRTASLVQEAPPEHPDDLRHRALALAAAGERREAIKLLMQASLGELARRRLIDWQPMLTNRHYQSQLRRRHPELESAFGELNALFERKVYGEQPASPAEFERALALLDHLREEGSLSSAS